MRILICALALGCAALSSGCGSDKLIIWFTAVDDAYAATGNVTLAVAAGNGLLVNDGDGVVTDFDAVSAMGGDVSVAPDGSFTYDPPAGFEGVDTFGYENDGGLLATVTVTITEMVWFVDDTAAAGGDGRLVAPFASLGELNAANGGGGADDPEAGDTIFVFAGSGAAYDGGIVLLDDQVLLGEGVDLVRNAATIVAAGTRPIVTNTTGRGIDLASRNTVMGLDVEGTSSTGIFAQNVAGPTVIDHVAVRNTTGSCFAAGGAMTGTITIGDTATQDVLFDGSGVDAVFFSSAGAGTLELFGVTVLNATFDGVDVQGSTCVMDTCWVGVDAGGAPGAIGDDGIQVTQSPAAASLTVVDCVVANTASAAIRPWSQGGNLIAASFSGVTVSDCMQGLRCTDFGAGANEIRLAVDDCTFGPCAAGVKNVEVLASQTDAIFVTSFAGNVAEADDACGGVIFDRVTFDADPDTPAFEQAPGGTLDIGSQAGPVVRVQGDGLRFDGPSGDIGFGTLNIANNAGTGLYVDTKTLGTTFNLGTAGGTVDTTGGAALFLDPPPGMPPLRLDMRLDAVRSSGHAGPAGIVENAVGRLRIGRAQGGGIVLRRAPTFDLRLPSQR